LILHTVAEPADEGRPHRVELLAGDLVRRGLGVEAVHVEDLGPVDVAHAGEHRLVHEGGANGGAAALELGPRVLGLGVLSQRVGAESRDDRLTDRRVDQRALGRADEVDGGVEAGHAQADGVPRRRGWRLVAQELAEQPEVYVDEIAFAEVVEEVLAVGLDAAQHPPVQPGGGIGEPALGRRHRHRPLR
jgi:hypothetical protein